MDKLLLFLIRRERTLSLKVNMILINIADDLNHQKDTRYNALN
jgi:hypothetical protein